MKLLIIAALSLFLCACQSNPQQAFAMPDWWSAPPEDSAANLYGVGEGYDLNSAVHQALANVAGKLRTNISASFSQRTQESNVAEDNYVDRKLSADTENVSLSHYETLKTANIDGRVAVLVRIDKQALADDWRRQYQQIERKINDIVLTKNHSFMWWLQAKSSLKDATHGDQIAYWLSSLTESEVHSELQKTLSKIIKVHNPSVSFRGDHPILNRSISDVLLASGLRNDGCLSCDMKIRYRTEFSTQTLFGEDVIKLDFFGSLEDREGHKYSSHWSVNASSVSGLEGGKQATLSIAAQKIKDEGLWKSFGIATK